MEEGNKELAAKTQRMEEAMLALLRHPHIIEGRGKVREHGRDVPSLLLEKAEVDLFVLLKLFWCAALYSISPSHVCNDMQQAVVVQDDH